MEARDEAFEAAVATVGAPSDERLETNDAGTGVAADGDDADEGDADDPAAEPGLTVDAAVVGCGHEEFALPLRAP